MQSVSIHRQSAKKSWTFKFPATLAMIALATVSVKTAQAALPPAPTASATITDTQINSTTFNYQIDVQDDADSANTVGTFWFSWVPGKDFMDAKPTSVTSPAGWTDNITGGGPGDGFAIQWENTATADILNPGNSLKGFSFDSTDTPAEIAGDSLLYPGTPVLTAFTYDAAPFSDAGDQILVTLAAPVTPPPTSTVPLPSAKWMGLIALSMLLAMAKTKRHAMAQ
jgi:hypothetical protein